MTYAVPSTPPRHIVREVSRVGRRVLDGRRQIDHCDPVTCREVVDPQIRLTAAYSLEHGSVRVGNEQPVPLLIDLDANRRDEIRIAHNSRHPPIGMDLKDRAFCKRSR